MKNISLSFDDDDDLGKASMEFLTLCIVLLGTSCVFGTIIYSIERTTNPTSTILFPNVGNECLLYDISNYKCWF